MRRSILAGGILCLAPFAACDTSTVTEHNPADCLVTEFPQTTPLKPPPAELTGADARYVHANVTVLAPFAMTDWCVNVSLISKADIDATGLFCLNQFESGDNTILANLKCDPSHNQTLVVTVEDVDHAGGDWRDNCGALGCFATVQCGDSINDLNIQIAVGSVQ